MTRKVAHIMFLPRKQQENIFNKQWDKKRTGPANIFTFALNFIINRRLGLEH